MSTEHQRLNQALRRAGWTQAWLIEPGTTAVASPHRLATEWLGFRLSLNTRQYYAKVLYEPQPMIDIQQSVEASRVAADVGVSPALAIADESLGVMVFHALPFANWRWAKVADLSGDTALNQLFMLKKRLHAAPVIARHQTRFDDIQRLLAVWQKSGIALPEESTWLNQCVQLAQQALGEPRQRVVLHGDGLASNVMVGPTGQLQLLDFDYACMGDAWFDLAITLNELFMFEDQWRHAICLWQGYCREADYARCRLHAFIDDWYWTLWAHGSAVLSGQPLEFAKLAQWTLLRCSLCVQDKRFESWLRLSSEVER